jgi:hypothetical protein
MMKASAVETQSAGGKAADARDEGGGAHGARIVVALLVVAA